MPHVVLVLSFALGLSGARASFAAAPTFQNPSVEDPNGTFSGPAQWTPYGQPIWTDLPGEARTGVHAIQISQYHRYVQAVSGCPARTHVTCLAYARAPEPPARLFLYTSFAPSTLDLYWQMGSVSLDSPYLPCAIPLAVAPAATRGTFFLGSSWSEDWIVADDVGLLLEQATNGGFEPDSGLSSLKPFAGPELFRADPTLPLGWQSVGAAEWDTTGAAAHSGVGAVRCDIHSGWTQEWAAASDGQTYVLVFWARSDVKPAQATVSFEWMDSARQILHRRSLALDAGTEWSPVVFALDPPNVRTLASGRLNLLLDDASTSDTRLWIDDVSWGWVGIYPPEFSPNEDGQWDRADVVAWWPGDTGTPITGSIASEEGLTTAVLQFQATPDGGPGMRSAEWDGNDAAAQPAPAGSYTARVSLPLDLFGTTAEVRLPVQVRREPSFPPAPVPFDAPEPFLAGIWLFLGGPWTNSDYNELFHLVHDDGFRYAIAFPALGRYRDCVRAAASHGIRIFLNFWETAAICNDTWHNRELTESEMESLLSQLIGEADADSTSVLGFYLADEPTLSLTLQRVSQFMRALTRVSPGRPGLSTLVTTPGWESRLGSLYSPIALFDRYPLREATVDPSQALLEYGRLVESLVRESAALGRPCWVIGQGISTAGSYEPPSPAGMRALVWVSLVAGARGFFPFLYLSTGNLEGLRGFDLAATPRLAALRETYARIDTLAPLLQEFRPDPGVPPPPSDSRLYTRVWSRTTEPETRLLWTVNLDLEASRTLQIELTDDQGTTHTVAALDPILAPGHATLFDIPLGWSVSHVLSAPIPSSPDPLLLTLPVLASAPVSPSLTINHLASDPSGRFLAVSCAENGFAGGGVHLLDVSQPRNPTTAARIFAWSAESSGFSDDGGFLSICDSVRGLEVYATPPPAVPLPVSVGLNDLELYWHWVGHSGNAHDVLWGPPGQWWLAAGFRGLRHLAAPTHTPPAPLAGETAFVTEGSVERLVWVPPRQGTHSSAGASASGRMALLDEYVGIDLVDVSLSPGAQPVAFLPVFRGRDWVAWNGTIALARQEYGLDLFADCDTTSPVLASHIDALSTLTSVALWQDRVLVALDGRQAVRFFDVLDPANPREIARVTPWGSEHPFLSALAVGRDWIGVAGRDRGVLLLDLAPLLGEIPTRTWMFY